MPCSRYREAIADRAAGGPVRPEVEGHLASCAACRSELDELRAALRLADTTLGALLAEEPGSGLRDRILRAAAKADESADPDADVDASAGMRHVLGWRRTGAVLAGGALTAAALLVAVWRSPSPVPVPREAAAPPPSAAPKPAEGLPAPVPGSATPREIAAVPARSTRPSKPPRAEPEVLVPPEEAEVLWRFAAGLRERAVLPGSLVTSAPEAPLVELRPIDLVPLEIVTLESSLDSSDETSFEEGDRP
jgi:hypothetical protein